MNVLGFGGRWLGAAALGVAALLSSAVKAADLSLAESLKDGPGMEGDGPHAGNDHATIPAGVTGGAMIGEGEFMAMYMPSYMSMAGNYIGTDKVSTKTVLSTPNRFAPPPNLRIVPDSMDSQMHMFGIEYGVTNAINVMVMGRYIDKDMTMTTYNMMGTMPIGTSTSTTSGFGDVMIAGLFRLYDDGVNHIHFNLGLSVPTGSTTEQATMLSPMGAYMTMRAVYGMQLGTGTYDIMPGLTYTGGQDAWSWGAAYRGRFALDDNSEGYHWGDLHQLTGWVGYTFYPGITATARVLGMVQGSIQGIDSHIKGAMEGTNPAWYGGDIIGLFGGIEIAGHEFGLGNTKLALEAGAPVYQNLNGPQVGQDWQLNAVLAVRF